MPRKLTAYNIFVSDALAKLKELYPDLKQKDLFKIAAREWKRAKELEGYSSDESEGGRRRKPEMPHVVRRIKSRNDDDSRRQQERARLEERKRAEDDDSRRQQERARLEERRRAEDAEERRKRAVGGRHRVQRDDDNDDDDDDNDDNNDDDVKPVKPQKPVRRVKRPLNEYNRVMSNLLKGYKSEYPDLCQTEIMKLANKEWDRYKKEGNVDYFP